MNGDVFCLYTYSNLLSAFFIIGASTAYKRCSVSCAITWGHQCFNIGVENVIGGRIMDMKAKQTIKFLVCCLLMAMLLPINTVLHASDSSPGSPEQVIKKLQSSLLQAMREGEKLSDEGRFKFLEPIIDQSHDIELIIKTILGATYWSQLDKEQRTLVVNTFRQLSIVTYADRFNQYEGEQFEVIEQRDLPHEQMLVRSQLTKSDGGTVKFDYILHQTEGRWRIINILFDGVSDLAIKRGEYRAIMQRDGFKALIESLKEKIALVKQD